MITNLAITTWRKVGCGKVHTTLKYDKDFKPLAFEFILGKAGGCASSQLYALQTVINYVVHHKLDIEPLFDKTSNYSLLGIRCPEVMSDDEEFVETPEEKLNLSCGDIIAKSMRYLLGKLKEMEPKKEGK